MNIDQINKGEIVFCNMTITYTRNKRQYKKQLTKYVFSRNYDDNLFPELDVIKNRLFINRWDRKNASQIENLKVVNLDILEITLYKHKY